MLLASKTRERGSSDPDNPGVTCIDSPTKDAHALQPRPPGPPLKSGPEDNIVEVAALVHGPVPPRAAGAGGAAAERTFPFFFLAAPRAAPTAPEAGGVALA
eukprot:CAMPEP_0194530020 /NCGR_PEP_ID=MMETSP0253-20130528/66857_1 /TAXON_ID=2966 /ORGANISM="Noctiluca scintillans" /LENGTH=100 /DNA_ID=CAMNT_0039375203 /DNA_START=138 /DNA_END=440 /DNA_ORIENTATION=+